MKYCLAIFFVMTCKVCFSQQESGQYYNKEIKAEIQMSFKENTATIEGVAINLTMVDKSIRYELSVFSKDSLNNTSKNNQSGRGVILAQNKAILSKTTVSTNTKNKLSVALLIYDSNDKLIGKELKEIKPFFIQEQKSAQLTNYGRLGLKGVVTKKTRTKPAGDFYNLFASEYLKYRINGDQVITVEERIFFGRQSRILIFIGSTLFYQFNLDPARKALVAQTDYTIREVYKYFQNRNKRINNQ